MIIKFNKTTQMWELIDKMFGTVIDHFSEKKDAIKFKKLHSSE